MLSSQWIIPFYAKPLPLFTLHFTNIADGTAVAFCRQSLTKVKRRHHKGGLTTGKGREPFGGTFMLYMVRALVVGCQERACTSMEVVESSRAR